MFVVQLTFFLSLPLAFSEFTPNVRDYDSYGLKIAMNKFYLIQTRNGDNPSGFLVQRLSNESEPSSSPCFVSFPTSNSSYVYSVGIGKSANSSHSHFFLVGEWLHEGHGIFIGIAKKTHRNFSCENDFEFHIETFRQYNHTEYHVLDVEPTGRHAYSFSSQFILHLGIENSVTASSWPAGFVWPDKTFTPHAVDITDGFGVIAGFVETIELKIVKYVPTIYLLNFNLTDRRPFVVDEFRPTPTAGTWQALLVNSDANVYSAKYDMSVSINDRGEVLIGMQFINRVFLLNVNTSNPTKLSYISRYTNGRSIGYGKAVAWLDNYIAAILVNTYSFDYHWSSSEIHFYDTKEHVFNSNSTPLSIFPNNYQTLPIRLSPVLLSLVSSSLSLSVINDQGSILVFRSTPSGFYPSFESKGSIVFFTNDLLCPPGTFKNQTGIHGCSLCPKQTRNSGESVEKCLLCSNESFCPLGSVAEIPTIVLDSRTQIASFPQSPESTIFDDVLLENMFHIGSGRCLLLSPLFWALMVALISLLMVIFISLLTLLIDHPFKEKFRKRLICLLRHADLIGQGELWMGGLASFSVVVLICFAYVFSNHFYHQYPIETSSDANFACDKNLRNSKFQTGTQSLAIPSNEAEKAMIDLLNQQIFYLHIDFVNTLITCDSVSIQALFGTRWSVTRWLTCENIDSILYLIIQVPYQHLSIEVKLDSMKTIGALRLGLHGDENQQKNYHLKALNFSQSFFKHGQLLAQSLPIRIDMTKVINETLPLDGEGSDFTGIFIPTFSFDINSLFLSNEQYIRSSLKSTVLTIVLDETPYYVKNLQQPIAKHSEIIFHNFLFSSLCLELFGIGFLFYKLILSPFQKFLVRTLYQQKFKRSFSVTEDVQLMRVEVLNKTTSS